MTNFFNATDPLTLQLEEDLSGANGDLAESVVLDRLVESIRAVAHIPEGDLVPIEVVAHLLLAMQRHTQADKFYLLAHWDDRNIIPKLDTRLDLRRAIGIAVECVAMRVMHEGTPNAA